MTEQGVPTEPITVLVADDQELVRDGLAMVLGAHDGIAVVGVAADGLEAVELARRHLPDVVLMDVRMPRLDGIAATARVLEAHPRCHVVVLTTFELDEYVVAALAAGASGFLLKTTPRRALVAAVHAVVEGDMALDKAMARRLITRDEPARPADARIGAQLRKLTVRELDVLRLVADGLTNAEIAHALFLGETTVKTHVRSLLQKLDARDRVHLVLLAHRGGA